MEQFSEQAILYGFIFLVATIVVALFISVPFFQIKRRNRYMETQIKLLAQIAAAQGCNIDKIAEIVVLADIG
jgi:hypothetical protein